MDKIKIMLFIVFILLLGLIVVFPIIYFSMNSSNESSAEINDDSLVVPESIGGLEKVFEFQEMPEIQQILRNEESSSEEINTSSVQQNCIYIKPSFILLDNKDADLFLEENGITKIDIGTYKLPINIYNKSFKRIIENLMTSYNLNTIFIQKSKINGQGTLMMEITLATSLIPNTLLNMCSQDPPRKIKAQIIYSNDNVWRQQYSCTQKCT